MIVFFCCSRNNGYAISTPTSDQYAGDGIGKYLTTVEHLIKGHSKYKTQYI